MQESAKPLLSNSYQYESIEQGDSSNLPSEVPKTSRSSTVFYGMVILVVTMAVVLLSGGRNIRNISPKVELPAQTALGLGQVMVPKNYLQSTEGGYRAANYNNDLVIYKKPSAGWPADSVMFASTPSWKLSTLLSTKKAANGSCFYGHFNKFFANYKDLATIGSAALASKGAGAALALSWTNNVLEASTNSQAMPSFLMLTYNSSFGSMTPEQKLKYSPMNDSQAIFYLDLQRNNKKQNGAVSATLKFVMQNDGNLVIVPASANGNTKGDPYFASNWGSNKACCVSNGVTGGSSPQCIDNPSAVAPYY